MLEEGLYQALELLTVLEYQGLVELEYLPDDVTGFELIAPILTVNTVLGVDALFEFSLWVVKRVKVLSLYVHYLGRLGHQGRVFLVLATGLSLLASAEVATRPLRHSCRQQLFLVSLGVLVLALLVRERPVVVALTLRSQVGVGTVFPQ